MAFADVITGLTAGTTTGLTAGAAKGLTTGAAGAETGSDSLLDPRLITLDAFEFLLELFAVALTIGKLLEDVLLLLNVIDSVLELSAMLLYN